MRTQKMLNTEKIRLMTQLAIFEKKQGRAVTEISRYFKGDYISNRILRMIVHYTLCFLLISGIVLLIRLESILMNLNLEFMFSAFRMLSVIYIGGLLPVLLITGALAGRQYEEAYRQGIFYTAKLEKLLELEEKEAESSPDPSGRAGQSRREPEEIDVLNIMKGHRRKG